MILGMKELMDMNYGSLFGNDFWADRILGNVIPCFDEMSTFWFDGLGGNQIWMLFPGLLIVHLIMLLRVRFTGNLISKLCSCPDGLLINKFGLSFLDLSILGNFLNFLWV